MIETLYMGCNLCEDTTDRMREGQLIAGRSRSRGFDYIDSNLNTVRRNEGVCRSRSTEATTQSRSAAELRCKLDYNRSCNI